MRSDSHWTLGLWYSFIMNIMIEGLNILKWRKGHFGELQHRLYNQSMIKCIIFKVHVYCRPKSRLSQTYSFVGFQNWPLTRKNNFIECKFISFVVLYE